MNAFKSAGPDEIHLATYKTNQINPGKNNNCIQVVREDW